jgi:hypothetical protein
LTEKSNLKVGRRRSQKRKFTRVEMRVDKTKKTRSHTTGGEYVGEREEEMKE